MLSNHTIATAKAALRDRVRVELKKMTLEERASASFQACSRLKRQTVWVAAKSILFYAPMPDEVDIWPLLGDAQAAGTAVFLPRYSFQEKLYIPCLIQDAARDLRTGHFGIREPLDSCAKISSNRLDLILVPGIAFHLDGHRLGRGKGFYDHLLAALEGPTCGVAFDQQIVSQIPAEPHDMRLSYILTPSRWHCVKLPRAVLK